RSTETIAMEECLQAVIMRVMYRRCRFVYDVKSSTQNIECPKLVLTHDSFVPKGNSSPHVTADGRASIAEEDVADADACRGRMYPPALRNLAVYVLQEEACQQAGGRTR